MYDNWTNKVNKYMTTSGLVVWLTGFGLMTSCRRRFGSIAGSIIRTKKSGKIVREEPLLNSDEAGEGDTLG